MNSPFSYPPRPWDRALAVAGQVERVVRAGVRMVRGDRLPDRRFPAQGFHPGLSERRPEGRGGPVIYLPAVAWGYRFQRPQHLALALARAGHPVLYVDGFLRSRALPARMLLREQAGVSVLRVRIPGRLDPYRSVLSGRAAVEVAEVIAAGVSGEPALVLVQLPFWGPLGQEISRRMGCPLVYDRIDLHTGFPGVPAEIEAAEGELIAGADLVAATAGALAELPRSRGARVVMVPNAADLRTFQPRARERSEIRIGYVGALGPWFDAAAVRAAAVAFPAWRFRLAGRVEDSAVAALSELPNVELAGEIPFREVPGFLGGVDAALIPFKDLPLTRAVDPVKLYEALAMGLPVVARRLPETERWSPPRVYLYESPEDFVRQLRRAVEEDSPELRSERRAASEGESWDRRAGDLLAAARSVK